MPLRWMPDGIGSNLRLWFTQTIPGRWHMVCPRCDRARIERDGVIMRCAVCGMSYDPNEETKTDTEGPTDPGSHWLSAGPLSWHPPAALHT